MTATIIHLLVERGQLSYDDPISKVWPEFAAHGKGGITLRQVLNHTAGIPRMPRDITERELHDWDTMCRKIAGLEPFTPAGAKMEYHAMTYGWLLGEVARRVDGRAFPQLLAEEICRPLGMEAMYAGIPDEVEPRVAILEEYGKEPVADDGTPQSVPPWLWPLHAWMNRPDARRACIPASNGIMNALSIARHYAALLPGGVDGVELLPPLRIKLATELQRPGQPQEGEPSQNRALGYMLGWACGNIGSSFGHGGYGGSLGFADSEFMLALGLTKNLFHEQDTVGQILKEVRDSIR
jgi:CubicO group peptidase (beta-lactamase class C family)